MSLVAVVDIDTTIANNEHRSGYLADPNEPNWEGFLRPDLMIQDSPVAHAREVLDFLRKHEYFIVFLTGRNELLAEVTSAWLAQHMGWNPLTEPLIMRSMRQRNMPASQYKEDAFLNFIRERKLERSTFLFFEDDPFVLRMWKKYGLVFQCPAAWASMNPNLPHGEELSWRR